MIKITKPMSTTEITTPTSQNTARAGSSVPESKLPAPEPRQEPKPSASILQTFIKKPTVEPVPPAPKAETTMPKSTTTLQTSPTYKSGIFGSLSSMFARLKKIKHIEIYAAVAVIAVMILIYISTFGSSAKSDNTSNLTNTEDAFVQEMEQKLVSTLSQIKGAGSIQAMVTAVGSATLEIAYNIDEKTVTQNNGTGSSNTTTTVVKTPVLVNGQPLVLLEIKPQLRGVVIVSSGASDPAVRLQLLRAVQALVADNSVIIEILTGK